MLALPLNERTVLLKPVPFFYLEAYQFFRRALPESIGDIAGDRQLWGLLQQTIDLHPRGDIDGWGFPLPEDYLQIASIVPLLDDLNKVDPLPPRRKTDIPEIPLKSSGDTIADLMADLASLYGVDGAMMLSRTFGMNQLNKIVTRTNERNRPEEDRRKEAMQDAHTQWLKDNHQLFAESLNLPADFDFNL